MTDPTPEKWQELNEKLEKEKAVSEAIREAQRGVARNLFMVSGLMLAVVIAAFVVFAGNPWIELIVAVPGLIMAVTLMFGLRYQSMSEHTRDDVERIQRDIRKWKKKKPG